MNAVIQSLPETLSQEELQNPYMVINDFYLKYAIDDVRVTIQNWMEDIYTPPNWNRKSPGDLLYFYKYLLRLIEACWLIKKTDTSFRQASISRWAVGKTEPELLDTRLYCPASCVESPWAFFPRSLSWQEYLRPYKVLRRFFKFRKLGGWKEVLQDLLHKAFIGRTLYSDQEVVDLIGFKKQLDKLADATHLINVREYEWKDGKFSLK